MEPLFDEPRSILGDDHARRALNLRRSLKALEMPCVRAATATLGVLLQRRRIPQELHRDIFAMAFDLPSDAARRAETVRDDAFLAGAATPAIVGDPPLRAGALSTAAYVALAKSAGLTDVAKCLSSLVDSPEAYEIVGYSDDFGSPPTFEFHTLFPFESAFPALVGCRTLTIRSTFNPLKHICLGGDVRNMRWDTDEHWRKSEETYGKGEFALRPVERTFTARRNTWRGPKDGSNEGALLHGDHFSVADLAQALTTLPEEWRQVGRKRGLVAFDDDCEGNLSIGRFEYPHPDPDRPYCQLEFGA